MENSVNLWEPPDADPHVRWCERSGVNHPLLLDLLLLLADQVIDQGGFFLGVQIGAFADHPVDCGLPCATVLYLPRIFSPEF